MQIKVKKGDNVRILSGKDKGKSGPIERVFPKDGSVVVTGLNVVKKHTSPRKRRGPGGIVTVPAPMPIGKVMVICPHCQKPTRVAVTIDQDGRRLRTCKQCHEVWNTKE